MAIRLLVIAVFAIALGPALHAVAPSHRVRSAALRPPLAFEQDRDIYTARLGDVAAELHADRLLLRLPREAAPISLRFIGASAARMDALEPLPGKANYILGRDPSAWRTGVTQYRRVRDAQLYAGIDLVYYGSQERLEHDFIVAPHSDPAAIAIEVTGATVALTSGGDAALRTAHGTVTLQRPIVYQERAGTRETISGAYAVHGERLAFEIGAYDRERPLVIDPIVVFSIPLGGDAFTQVNGVTQDAAGNLYATGFTQASDFPVKNAAQATCSAGCGNSDAFLIAYDPTGTTILYSTFFGGFGIDQALAVAVDGNSNAYITGTTASSNFPVKNAFQATATNPSNTHAFAAKFDATGALVYSTFLAGSGSEDFNNGYDAAIAVDASGSAYVAGSTTSTDFPLLGAFQATRNGTTSGFVAKLAPAGSSLVYSTYLGGAGTSATSGATGIAVDSTGAAYVTGNTTSASFPTTVGALATTCAACASSSTEAWVAKLAPSGAALAYATFLGDAGGSTASAIAIDTSGDAFVAGTTSSKTFPTVSAVQPVCTSCTDSLGAGFVSKLNPAGSALLYSSFLTGHGQTTVTAIAVDGTGQAYVAGSTDAPDFPSVNPAQQVGGLGIGIAWRRAATQIHSARSNKGFASAQTNAIATDPVNPTDVYAATLDGVFKSTDGGATWAAANNGLPAGNVQSLAIANGAILVGIATKGVFRSTDHAASFTATTGLPGAPGTIGAIAFDPTNASIAYAGIGAGPILFKSVNGGASWTSSATNLPAGDGFFTVTGIVVDPATPAHIFLSSTDFVTAKGVFASSDGGATWAVANTGLNTLKINALAMDSAGTLYAGSDVTFSGSGGGVFKSANNGASWTQALAAGGFNVEALGTDAPSGTIFAGLQSAGLVTSVDHGTTWSTTDLTFASVASMAVVPDIDDPTTEVLLVGFAKNVLGNPGSGDSSFETQLSADGTSLVSSTYLGGPSHDQAAGVTTGGVAAINAVQPLAPVNFGISLPGNNLETEQAEIVETGTRVSDVSVTKSADKSVVGEFGLITYTITIKNAGPDPAYNPVAYDVLPDPIPAGSYHEGTDTANARGYLGTFNSKLAVICDAGHGTSGAPFPPLPVGASVSCTFTVFANELGDVVNTAVLQTDSTDPDHSNNTSSKTVTITLPPNSMTDRPLTLSNFILGSANQADIPLTNASTTVDADVTSVTVSCDPTVSCSIVADGCSGTSVAPGATCHATLGYAGILLGAFTGTVTVVNNTTGSPQHIPITGTVVDAANLSAMDIVDNATASNGDIATYALVATNNGPGAAPNPTLVDTVQPSMDFSTVQYLDGVAPNGGVVQLTTDLPTRTVTCTIQGGGQLQLGDVFRCRFTVQANGAGTSTNTLLVTDDVQDPAATGNTASATTFIQDPAAPTFAPAGVAFGSFATATATVTVADKNSDATAFLNVKTATASCTPTASCAIVGDTCSGAHVGPLQTCDVEVEATCTSLGTFTGSVHVADFTAAGHEDLAITGICTSASTTTLVSSAATAAAGTAVTFTATVTTGASGTVTFFDGATSLGTATLAGGTAAFATSALAVGVHAITATYGGDAAFGVSTSAPLTQTITQPATTATTTTLAASPNPAGVGAAVTFTATVAPVGTGSVTFAEGTTLGTGTLGSGGTATFTTSTLPVGVHAIVATYAGDASFGASTSSPLQLTVTEASDYAIAASPQTLTIPSGASGSTTLAITPTGGFSGELSLACSDFAPDASCSFSPATVMLDGSNTPATVQLTVDTALAKAASRKTGGGHAALILFGAVGFFGGKRRRAAKLLLLFGMLACGGDSTPHGTPPGSYPLTVTASGAATHATTLTVIVQ